MDMQKLRLYRDLRRQAKEHDAESDALNEEANKIERELIEAFAEDGVQSVNVDGTTVYLKRDLYSGREEGVETADVMEALRQAGQGHLVTETVNGNTLAAYLRNLDENDEPLPEPLVGVVKPVEVFRIQIRAAARSKASQAINPNA